MTQIHFRASNIDREALDRLAELSGCENRSEYLRRLVIKDADQKGVSIHEL